MANSALKVIGCLAMFALLLITALLAATFFRLLDPRNVVVSTFVAVLFEHPFFIPFCLVVLPSLLWKRSMFLGYSAPLGLLLLTVWAIGKYDFIFIFLALSYAIGAAARVFIYASITLEKSKQLHSTSEKAL